MYHQSFPKKNMMTYHCVLLEITLHPSSLSSNIYTYVGYVKVKRVDRDGMIGTHSPFGYQYLFILLWIESPLYVRTVLILQSTRTVSKDRFTHLLPHIFTSFCCYIDLETRFPISSDLLASSINVPYRTDENHGDHTW